MIGILLTLFFIAIGLSAGITLSRGPIAFLYVVFAAGIAVIILVGYPGDGSKGYPTAFGRMERAHPPLVAGYGR